VSFTISSRQLEKIKKELKWRFNGKDQEIEAIVASVIEFLNSIEEIINPENIEPVAQNILKLVFDNGIPEKVKINGK
jgi:F0F1-type ATP synthase delta subunit